MRYFQIMLIAALSPLLVACAGSGFEVRSVGFTPKTTGAVAKVADAVIPKPRCKADEALITERQADVRVVSDSNGVRGRPNIGQPGRPARELTARERRNQPRFIGQESDIFLQSDSGCVPVGR